jgi:hypothetical protein
MLFKGASYSLIFFVVIKFSFHLVPVTCGKERFESGASFLILSWYTSSSCSKCLFLGNAISPQEHCKCNWRGKSGTIHLFSVEGRSGRSVELATFHTDNQRIPVQRKYTGASCRFKSRFVILTVVLLSVVVCNTLIRI